MNASNHPAEAERAPVSGDAPPDDIIREIYRQLVGIHASIAVTTNDDKEIVPWTERELRGVLRYIERVRRERRAALEEASARPI